MQLALLMGQLERGKLIRKNNLNLAIECWELLKILE